MQDLKYALRAMGQNWRFSAVVVLSLTLGIGANTAIFTLIDAVMLRTLPVRDPQSLLLVGTSSDSRFQRGFTYQQYKGLRDGNTVIDMTGYSMSRFSVS